MTIFHLTQKLKFIRIASLLIGLFITPFVCSNDKTKNPETQKVQRIQPVQSEQTENSQHIIITSRKSPLSGHAPTTQSTFRVNPEQLPKMANSLTELVEGTPGVAENSQPGLFQVLSIRGVSRQRVLTLLDGVRLSSERRAGTSASFIDPSLFQGISITRGPASTYYGSGAMGGLIQLDLKKIFGHAFSVGFDSVGKENYQNLSWGSENESSENHLSVVRRQANNSKDINNNLLNTHFKQLSGLVQNSYDIHKLKNIPLLNQSKIDTWFFTSKGNDLGRSNARFPNRIVNISDEKHHIIKTSITSSNQWSADFYMHDQTITTQSIRPNQSIIDVANESQDFGFNWQIGWDNKNQISKGNSSNLFGIDFYTRKNVNSREYKKTLVGNVRVENNFIESNLVNIQTLNDAGKDELAAFYSYHFLYEKLRFQAGGRFTFEQSKNTLSNSQSNTALTAFAGIAHDIYKSKNDVSHFEVNANIGNAFRSPSLTELYFGGTTARGQIQGNENLDAEESVNFEFGFNWKNRLGQLKMTLFENSFNHYIERVIIGINEQGDDILTFVNLQDGKIRGLETEYEFKITNKLNMSFIATLIEGKNGQNQPLADIPSDRSSLSFIYYNNALSTQLKLQHRRTKNAFGNSELATKSTNLLSASLQYQINNHWLFKLVGENLLDSEYVASSDDLATLMPGRSFGFSVVWHE